MERQEIEPALPGGPEAATRLLLILSSDEPVFAGHIVNSEKQNNENEGEARRGEGEREGTTRVGKKSVVTSVTETERENE